MLPLVCVVSRIGRDNAATFLNQRGPRKLEGDKLSEVCLIYLAYMAIPPPPPRGTCFNFHSGRGGGGPLPPGPPPPLPPQLKCTRKPGFWEHFLVIGTNFSAPSAHTIHCVHIAPCVLHLPCFPDFHALTLVVSVFQLPGPTVATRKREDVIDALSILGLKLGSPVIKDKKPRYPLIQS